METVDKQKALSRMLTMGGAAVAEDNAARYYELQGWYGWLSGRTCARRTFMTGMDGTHKPGMPTPSTVVM